MKTNTPLPILKWLALAAIILAYAMPHATAEELDSTGKDLKADYEEQAKELKTEIMRELSFVDAATKNAYEKARDAEAEARKTFEKYNQGIKGGVKKAQGLVNHAKNNWIRGADNGIKKAKQQIKNAKNDRERKKAEQELAKWEKNREEGLKALEERQQALELAIKAEKEGPRLIKEATEAMAEAQAEMDEVLTSTGLSKILIDGALDDKLAKYVVIQQATPEGLALYAQKSPQHKKLIDNLLADPGLMKAMLIADGAERAKNGHAQYGPAMQIYTEILATSQNAKSGVLNELALATALEHSVPNKLRSAKADTDAPEHVNPITRYLAYEKAYLNDELDPAFINLNAWELRHVVNGEEPDELLEWGRTMMRNFRPEQTRGDYGWRYVRIVTSDVQYGSHNVPLDRPELQFFQNIIMNGGICGRRAFFGRFVLRAFGIPTIARPSRGHAALAHWTPKGWVVNLGPGWGGGWTKTRYQNGLDFVATTQARSNREEFPVVKRAQWIGNVHGEQPVYGEREKTSPDFWNAMSLHMQRRLITKSKSETLEALGTNLGEADGSSITEEADATDSREKEKITTSRDGSIKIPAAAFSSADRGGVQVTESYDEGMQVFMPRFSPKGLSIVRGTTWKTDADSCGYSSRGLSAGYGRYENWGMRAAVYPPEDKTNLPEELELDLGDGITMEFVYIRPGTFTMGGDDSKESKWSGANTPKHEVTISKGFYLGKHEVTQEQYEAVMGNNPSKHRDPKYPVDNIGETDAERFCVNMSSKTGVDVKVPTEAEWEYAARAGTDKPWPFKGKPDVLAEYAWFKDNAGGKPHPVGLKKPNPWGLHGMYGNVCERVRDRYDKNFYKNSPEVDPVSLGVSKTSAVEYEIRAPRSGEYDLTAEVVTVNYDQHLMVSVNGGEPININLPYTSGERQHCEPVTINLRQGTNTLEFYRIAAPQKGIAIKSFNLNPAN